MRKVFAPKGVLPRLETPDGGEIRLDGEDVLARGPRLASLRSRGRVQVIFQDSCNPLNPVHDVGHHLQHPLLYPLEAHVAEGAT
jgi:peptide/nickel transport system ATP-binding protein